MEMMIHPGSVAFLEAFAARVSAALDETYGAGKIVLARSGACHEYPALTRYVVEVHGEHDAIMAGPEWLTRVDDVIRPIVGGPIHYCAGNRASVRT